jgi:hypothetical protein
VVLGGICVAGEEGVFYTMEGIVEQWRERRDWRTLRDNGEGGLCKDGMVWRRKTLCFVGASAMGE